MRQFNTRPLHQNLENFRVFRAKARRTIRESKRKSWKQYVSRLNSRTSIKKVWDMVRKIQGTSRKLLRIKVTPDLHLTDSKNGGNLGFVLKMKNIVSISILLTKHVKYTYLYLFKFVLYSIVAFKVN